jgi:hypothetical protein
MLSWEKAYCLSYSEDTKTRNNCILGNLMMCPIPSVWVGRSQGRWSWKGGELDSDPLWSFGNRGLMFLRCEEHGSWWPSVLRCDPCHPYITEETERSKHKQLGTEWGGSRQGPELWAQAQQTALFSQLPSSAGWFDAGMGRKFWDEQGNWCLVLPLQGRSQVSVFLSLYFPIHLGENS